MVKELFKDQLAPGFRREIPVATQIKGTREKEFDNVGINFVSFVALFDNSICEYIRGVK